MTEQALRAKVVETAKAYLGCNELEGTHRPIIDLYNSHTPLARKYKVQYTDAWCATFVSAIAIACGLTDIMPTECGCGQMIELYRKLNRWEERDDHSDVRPGDVIFYDWDDSGLGDDTGWPEHVGIVCEVGEAWLKIIEGNLSNAVKYRQIGRNAKFIRGFGLPDYAAKADAEPAPVPVPTPEVVAPEDKPEDAAAFDPEVAGQYAVTAAWLNVRHGAGTDKPILMAIPSGQLVRCYGYYTEAGGKRWLYVRFQLDSKWHEGYCSERYLVRR